MIYSMVPFPVILSDPWPKFQGHGVIIDALNVLCAQLTRDLFAIAKFLFTFISYHKSLASSNAKTFIKTQKQRTRYRAVELRKRVEHVEAMHIYNSSIYTQLSSM